MSIHFRGRTTCYLEKSFDDGRITILETLMNPANRSNDNAYSYVVLVESDKLPDTTIQLHKESSMQQMLGSHRHLPAIPRYGELYRLNVSRRQYESFPPSFSRWLRNLPSDERVEGVPGRILFFGRGRLDPPLLDHLRNDGEALYNLFVTLEKEPEIILAGRHNW